MWWASVVSATSGASLASFAIRSSRVETVLELGVSVIFLSNGSVIRRRPLLHGVPRVGSPASSLLLRRSDFPAPLLRSLALRSAVPQHIAAEASGSLRFLGNPLRHAVLYDPQFVSHRLFLRFSFAPRRCPSSA